MSQQVADHSFEEWQQARSVLARFDNNLHDLRKYGFSFITGLLTADTLLGQQAANANITIPNYVKLAVFIVTLGLVCTLKLLDMHYSRFENAASMRAKILEKRLNLDLGGTISFFYDHGALWRFVQYVYLMFIGLTALLALSVLWPDIPDVIGLAIASILAAIVVNEIHKWKGKLHTEDWSVDKKIAYAGEPIRITWTNLNTDTAIKIPANSLAWIIRGTGKDEEKLCGESPILARDIILKGELDSYDWLWYADVPPGLYRLMIDPLPEPKERAVIQILKPAK